MPARSPLQALSSALHHAALLGLPPVQDPSGAPELARRPDVSECRVRAMFTQTWGSTALGFGGLGGAAMTSAYTLVIEGPQGDLAVYWNGRFGYRVLGSNRSGVEQLMADVAKQVTASTRDAIGRYLAEDPDLPSDGALSAFEDVAARAMHHATLVGLPAEKRVVRDYASTDKTATKELVNRPHPQNCQMLAAFLQQWPEPDLGWAPANSEGPCDTDAYAAYTLAIQGPDNSIAVYWDGLPAFFVAGDNVRGTSLLRDDLSQRACAHLAAALPRYGAQPLATT